jgi:trehalose 6-phosphate synthase
VAERRIIIASNRGPVSFVREESGKLVPHRGMGGLVTALTGALELCGGLWVASAMTEEDRELAAAGRMELATGRHPYGVRYLTFDPQKFDLFYNGIANRVLWFVHHYLWDIPVSPRFGDETAQAWDAYREVNALFAAALHQEGAAMPSAPVFLVQDYHLALVPALLRDRQPEARISHFTHTPFAGPGYFRILPNALRGELLSGLLGADVLGFQARAWADNFLLSCRSLPGARVDLRRRVVRWQDRVVRVRVYPISIDAEGLEALARSDSVARARRSVTDYRSDGKLILRVDRGEPSKNIIRGFMAYEAFLRHHREWRGKVRFLALANPSRMELPEYRAYIEACMQEVARINAELGHRDWQPVEFSLEDDYPRALAAYEQYDVLLVNPVFDGMNLVAKEGSALNRRNGVLVLSENAGAFAELGRHALGVNPFDVGATAEAIATALAMDPGERARRARGLRASVRRNPLDRWVRSQLADLEQAHS